MTGRMPSPLLCAGVCFTSDSSCCAEDRSILLSPYPSTSRFLVAICSIVTLSLFAVETCPALQPDTRLTQYAHRIWRIGDNGLLGTPQSITQTTDGYIWVATSNGIFRFDGEHFIQWVPSIGLPLPSSSTWYSFGARDGSLYVGTDRGLVRILKGRAYRYPGSPRWPGPFVQDAQGNVWMGVSGAHSDPNAICKVGSSSLQCFGARNGFSCTRGLSNTIGPDGSIWIGGDEGICRWNPESPSHSAPVLTFRRPIGLRPITSMATGADGELWAGTRTQGNGSGLLHCSAGKWTTYVTPAVDGRKLSVSALLGEQKGTLWIGTTDSGLYRLANGHLEHFDTLNGLSDHNVLSIFEDHEGGVWVVTPTGIDFFRDYSVLSFTSSEGSRADHANAVTTDREGSVYLGSSGLMRLHGFELTPLRDAYGLPIKNVQFLFTDSRGNVWSGADNGLTIFGADHKTTEVQGYGSSPGTYIDYITEDVQHDIWAAIENLRSRRPLLLRIRNARVIGQSDVSSVLGNQVINALAPNSGGGLWLGGSVHGLYRFRDGRAEKVSADGFDDRVENLMSEPDGSLWLVTPHGFLRYAEGRMQKLTVENGLPCEDGVNIQEDAHGDIWFYMHCGIARVSDSDLAAWWADPKTQVHPDVFDAICGARPNLSNGSPARTPDGDLWSANDYAFQVIKSRRLPFNPVPPPVVIERIVVDGQEFVPRHDLELPIRPNEIQIAYAGLSYLIPDLVQFRYRLQGQDTKWIDAGNRRAAFFTNLAPGHYVFQVIACNNDGVWNLEGARFAFTIRPAWYQTLLFRILALLLAIAILILSYLYRLRRFAATLKVHFDARLQERTRLARDLHDTLLQTIQGSKMVADDARAHVNDLVSTTRALDRLSDWLDRASIEGRAALEALRMSSLDSSDLSESLRQIAEDCAPRGTIAIEVSVTGRVRELHPIARDEVYRIAYEAIRNACAHSKCTKLKIDLIYRRNFTLTIRDNGRGIDDVVLLSGRTGHFGLIGMRERAAATGGKLTISSSEKHGTVVSVLVPGRVMYESGGRKPKFGLRDFLGF